ncbi:MAG TPA: hypothetical protein VHZ07_09480 [Bryobacteraceae bacterium]|jgi:hypothetical protein|nr:hypothetical protein [Bryobacteraceae bacterium]
MRLAISPEDREFLNEVTALLDAREYSQALRRTRDLLLRADFKASEPRSLLLKAELAGCLVSIGAEGKIKEAVAQGLWGRAVLQLSISYPIGLIGGNLRGRGHG